ncbi:hypothetical protein [Methylomagnum sp.]
MTGAEFKQLLALSHLDLSNIEPAIFGILFERGLDPAKRSQLGAHYTDRESIMRLVDPVIREPLLAEWEAAKIQIAKSRRSGMYPCPTPSFRPRECWAWNTCPTYELGKTG